MRNYELVTVISPEIDEEAVLKVIDEMGKFIGDRGGIVDSTDKWGKRKLAYPLRKFTEGNYLLTRFQAEPQLIKEIKINLNASENILRHLIVRVGD